MRQESIFWVIFELGFVVAMASLLYSQELKTEECLKIIEAIPGAIIEEK